MKSHSIDAIEFRGGRLCLDFINTANWEDERPVDERLIDLDALSIWVTRQGLTKPSALSGDLRALLELREAIRRIILNPLQVSDDDLGTLNDARSHLAPLGNAGAQLGLNKEQSTGWVARAIADSAVELVLTTDRTRIKTCHGERCGWLFLDESPNNRRRWCSMADCGNRAKARRHYNARKNDQQMLRQMGRDGGE